MKKTKEGKTLKIDSPARDFEAYKIDKRSVCDLKVVCIFLHDVWYVMMRCVCEVEKERRGEKEEFENVKRVFYRNLISIEDEDEDGRTLRTENTTRTI